MSSVFVSELLFLKAIDGLGMGVPAATYGVAAVPGCHC